MKRKYILLIICISAFLIRFIGIDSIPPGVNRDEASIGYTAYSLLKTGMDEYGRKFPLSFQSFGDWKLPLYIYGTIPIIALFGLSEISVRLLSVLCGTLSVALLYILVIELFRISKHNIQHKYIDASYAIALLSAVLLTLSPWHIHFSRVAYEANVAVTLVLAGTLLLLKSYHNNKLLLFSFLFYALSLYTYHGNHVFTPIFIIGVCIIIWHHVRSNKYIVHSTILFIILSSIIFKATFFEANATKLSGIGIFGDPTTIHTKIELPRLEHNNQNITTKILHNKYLYASERFVQNYLNAFSPEFLFIKGGGNKAHNIPEMGNLYLIDAPFLLIGILVLLVNYRHPWAQLLLLWIIVSPIAPSITKDAPHSARMFSIIPALMIAVSIGIYTVYQNTALFCKKVPIIAFILITLAYSLLSIQYFDKYSVHFPISEWNNWGIKYKALTVHIKSLSIKPDRIVIPYPEESPYIFMLFYSSYDPLKFQTEVKRYPMTSDGFLHVASFINYEFRDIDWNRDIYKKTLIAITINSVPDNIKSSFIPINLPNTPLPIFYVSNVE